MSAGLQQQPDEFGSMNLPEQNMRKPRSCENGCGICQACKKYPLLKNHRNLGQHYEIHKSPADSHGLQLEIKGYRSGEIVDNIIGYVFTGVIGVHNLQPLRKNAQKRWSMRWIEYDGLKLDQRGVADLRFYFDVFNDYFFCGTLSSTNVCWGDADRMDGAHQLGYTSLFENGQFEDIADIRLRRSKINVFYYSDVNLGILSTLLHEMTHALITLYTCSCCCAINTEGVLGHGTSWLRLGQAIESEANRVFPEAGKWDLVAQVTPPSNWIYRIELKALQDARAIERLYEKTMLWEISWLHEFEKLGSFGNPW